MLAGNLRDLARINRWLGGVELSWRAIEHVRSHDGHQRELTMLDVGTGSGDIPVALLERARRRGWRLRIEGTDVRPEIVALARDRTAGEPHLQITLAEPDGLEYEDGSFDVVHASLLVHHHEPAEARKLIAELGRVARRAVVVNDLHRARRWWIGAWLLSRVATRNRYTRHDAPLSVRRAYTPAEIRHLAATAGLRETKRFRDRLGHRYALVLERAS